MGQAYMAYARQHPLKYRLMFNTPMPPLDQHPELKNTAHRTFTLLKEQISKISLKPLVSDGASTLNKEALFVWSVLHGLASILQSDALGTLGLSDDELNTAISHCFIRLGMAIETPVTA